MRYAGSAWRYGLWGPPYAPLAANVLAGASPLARSERERRFRRGASRLAPALHLANRPTQAWLRPRGGDELVGLSRRTPVRLPGIDQLAVYHAVIRVTDDQLARSSVRRALMCHTARLLQGLAPHPLASVRQRDLPYPTHADVHTDRRQIHRLTSRCVAASRRGAGLPDCRVLPADGRLGAGHPPGAPGGPVDMRILIRPST